MAKTKTAESKQLWLRKPGESIWAVIYYSQKSEKLDGYIDGITK